MSTQATFFGIAAAAIATAVYAGFAERRRQKRKYFDQVGWVPWNFIQVLGGIFAVIAAVLALKLG
jgi:hypothetical protein